jgi:N-acetyl-anhydromuramyl-L-alanine amidase AmpD
MKNTHTYLSISGILFLLLLGCSAYQPVVVDRPIPFGETRKELTREYLKDRYGLSGADPGIHPRMIVLHWTAIPSLEGSLKAFEPERLPGARGDIQSAGALNVSAHYLIDRDGTIYHLMPDTVMARHTIGLNHCAIGIENVGGTPETPLTEAQFKSNAWLVRQLADRFPIEYLIGHYEYTAFEGHPLWLEKDAGYRTEKTDPGSQFMKKIRRSLKDLAFKPIPQTPSR